MLCVRMRAGMEWFEALDLLRKLALTGLLNFLTRGSPFQARAILHANLAAVAPRNPGFQTVTRADG